MKLCRIYIIAVIMKFLCSVISSLYTMSSEHDELKNHSMKGFYQMLKLAVICIGSILVISTLISQGTVIFSAPSVVSIHLVIMWEMMG